MNNAVSPRISTNMSVSIRWKFGNNPSRLDADNATSTDGNLGALVTKRVRKTGEEKAYPQSVLRALKEKSPLYANRRGIVPLNAEKDKPIITSDELYKNRRLGLSFKSIGKKLGIECSRDEVVRVFDIIRDNSPGNVPDIQALRVPVKRNLPTPLCFCFNSELDLIAMLYPRRLISLVLVHKFESQNDLGKTQHGCCKYILQLGRL